MKLKKLKLKNFRKYADEVSVDFNDLTSFIGKNDAGKSTVLEALEIFFNNKLIAIESDDLNVFSKKNNNNIVEITCIFNDLPSEVVLDSDARTTLEEEYLLNSDGNLEIKKTYDCSKKSIKPNIFIKCIHPYNEKDSLLLKKNTELKKIALDKDIETKNKSSNVQLRSEIYNHEEIAKKECLLEVNKEDAKAIYSSIEKILPMYALFQSDRNSNDTDEEVVNPMKLAIDIAIQNAQKEIEAINKIVQEQAIETATRTLSKMREMNPDLADELTPVFSKEPNFNSLYKLSINSDNGVPMNKRGSGVRRLLLLNFFRAEAERLINSPKNDKKNVIYAFEEPETAQHPDQQKIIIKSFFEIVNYSNNQVILTTHTPGLAELLSLKDLRFITTNNLGKNIIKNGNDDVFKEIVSTLGVHPQPFDNNTKGLLLVEGKGDVVFIKHIWKKLYEARVLTKELESLNIAIVPTGGCGNLKSWSTYKLAEQFSIPWFVLLDSDKSTQTENQQMNIYKMFEDKGITTHITRKREPENYLHVNCFLPIVVEFSDTDDAKKIINKATKTPKTEVLEEYIIKMEFEEIREMEKYTNSSGEELYEFTEFFQKVIDEMEEN